MSDNISRSTSRESAVVLVFMLGFGGADDAEAAVKLACDCFEIKADSYTMELVKCVGDNKPEIDALIERFSNARRASRISHIALAVMEVCLCEIKYKEIPVPIAINEAMEIVKKYDPESAAFVNGVLNNSAKADG